MDQYPEVLIEEFIPGYEITCFIIGNRGKYYLNEPIIYEYDGIRYFDNFIFGMKEKANRKRQLQLLRNVMDHEIVDRIRSSTQIAFEALGLHDFARADFRLQKNGRLVFIEINGNPVISQTSEVGAISHELGTPFGEIVGKIIVAAKDRLNLNRE